MNNNKSSKLGVGLVIGSVLGGLAAFFLSPKSGKENREMVEKKINEIKIMIEEKKVQERVKEIYGEVTEEGTRLYTAARDDMNARLDELKKTVEEIDMAKYKAMVNDVMDRLREESENSGEKIAQLREYFMEKWAQVKTEVKSDSKEVAKGAKRAAKGETEEEA